MRTVLICSAGSRLNREVMPAFLASTFELAGIVEIEDRGGHALSRLRFEWKRSGLRVVDVLAFRIYYELFLSGREGLDDYVAEKLAALPPAPDVPVLKTQDANSPATRMFLESLAPDLALAACKSILRPEIFGVPRYGTFVVHPGICPEYRNAHGCFWALSRRDLEHVGATLLRIDEGVDTGPVYAYYRAPYDERAESHVVIQRHMVYENLEAIGRDLKAVVDGRLQPIDVSGRESVAWGQPHLTDYLRWKRAARAGDGATG
jgi:folate-dependent phosphoribosylglycinamide formyltransferase PurN